jgi:cysteine desulfurase
MSRQVYMDYAATTFTAPEVVEEMLPFFTESFHNPSSLYSFSERNREAIARARHNVAATIGAGDEEIFFTAGGSEADNWALKGIAFALREKGRHIITTEVEHKAILETVRFLERDGFEITLLPVDGEGFIRMEELRQAMREDTILVSVMFANNAVGTIQPVAEIGKLCRDRGVLFHTDGVQAVAHVPIDVKSMNIDLLSMAGHKFYGPKGVGALFIRKGLRLENLIHGGGQERGQRATPAHVPGIIGMGKAAEMALSDLPEESGRISRLRDGLIAGLLEKIPHTKLNGPYGEQRLPNNANLSFIGVEGETLLLDLDMAGIAASTGSACASASLDPSHVLLAMGLPHEMAHGSVRLSLGMKTTDEDVDYVLETLPEIVHRRREMSPLWEDFLKKMEKGA